MAVKHGKGRSIAAERPMTYVSTERLMLEHRTAALTQAVKLPVGGRIFLGGSKTVALD
jgi:hypothetical protein